MPVAGGEGEGGVWRGGYGGKVGTMLIRIMHRQIMLVSSVSMQERLCDRLLRS